jgi:hypothetical protein
MLQNQLDGAQRERLKEMLVSGSRLGASDLRLLNIDVYRERLGEDWFKYKSIINALAATAIKAELGPEDFFVETRGGYGLFFFQKDLEQVQTVSDRIAERLQHDLAREPAFGDPPLGCEAESVNCDDLLRQLENETAEQGGEAPPAVEIERVVTRYIPLWHAKFERVVGSVFVPVRAPALRRFRDADYYAPGQEHVQRDIRAFEAMLLEIYKLHKSGTPSAVIFSLNFKSFCAAEFGKQYLNALRQTPVSLLPYLTPRFVRIPPGTPQSMLVNKMLAVRTLFRRVVLSTRPVVDERTFDCVPSSILSTSWKEIEHVAGNDKERRAQMADAFCHAAKRLKLNALIEGVETDEALGAAVAAGAEFLAGGAVRPASKAPFPQQALALSATHAARARRRSGNRRAGAV